MPALGSLYTTGTSLVGLPLWAPLVVPPCRCNMTNRSCAFGGLSYGLKDLSKLLYKVLPILGKETPKCNPGLMKDSTGPSFED